MATTTITTAEELLAAGDIGRCELLRGELMMMSPAGSKHGRIVTRITVPLAVFASQHSLGAVYGAETGFRIGCNPDNVRAPDMAFVCSQRAAADPESGFFPGPPDLAAEVLSPEDRAGEVLEKVHDWLDSGCRAVWVVDPRTRTVAVYRSRSDILVLSASDVLGGGDLLPGFSLPVSEIF